MFDVIFEKYPQLKNEMIAEAKWRYSFDIQKPLVRILLDFIAYYRPKREKISFRDGRDL
jgi:hypothetical protein